MQTVNLKKYYYPLFVKDTFVEVSDEMAEALLLMHREENNRTHKIWYHKAYYSLDCEDGIENCALDFTTKSPEDILVEREEEQLFLTMLGRLAEAMGDLTDIQTRRIHARYVLGKKLAETAAEEGVSVSVVQQTIKSALKRMWRYFEKKSGGNEGMNFTKGELEMLYQYAASTKEETLAGLKKIIPILERKDDLLTKMIVENTVRKLEKLAEPECSRFIAENRAAFIAERDKSIRRRLAEAGKKEPPLMGHDLAGTERFLPGTRHMVTVEILNSDSPVGFPGERYHFFLSDEGYQNTRASEGRGEVKIRSHAAVCAGKLYPDKKPKQQER